MYPYHKYPPGVNWHLTNKGVNDVSDCEFTNSSYDTFINSAVDYGSYVFPSAAIPSFWFKESLHRRLKIEATNEINVAPNFFQDNDYKYQISEFFSLASLAVSIIHAKCF